MKSVLITGANKGIGFEIARQLGKKEFRVIISGRNQKSLQEAFLKLKNEIPTVEMLVMDVSRPESIKQSAVDFSKLNFKLDVLVNNAAILLPDDKSLLKNNNDILEQTIQTNSYGALNVIKEFLPFINSPGRIINVSSEGGSMSENVGGWSPAYCVSKTLLNALTRYLAYELDHLGISMNAVCPGWVRTDMGGRSAPVSIEKGAETPVWLAQEASQNLTGKFFKNKKEIEW